MDSEQSDPAEDKPTKPEDADDDSSSVDGEIAADQQQPLPVILGLIIRNFEHRNMKVVLRWN